MLRKIIPICHEALFPDNLEVGVSTYGIIFAGTVVEACALVGQSGDCKSREDSGAGGEEGGARRLVRWSLGRAMCHGCSFPIFQRQGENRRRCILDLLGHMFPG